MEGHAEGLGDAVGGDVVVGGADAAGGEDIVVAGAQVIDGGDDLLGDVAHHASFAEVDPVRPHELGDGVEVHVLGAARENLVADDQRRRRDPSDRFHARLPPLGWD